MQFDYYSASVQASASYCHDAIIQKLGGAWEAETAVNNYKIGLKHDQTGLKCFHGGHNPGTFLLMSGQNTPALVPVVRELFPIHKVSRADVCRDFDFEGSFETLHALLAPIAKRVGITPTLNGPEQPHPTIGRTMYYGSRKSAFFLTLYEKGKERLSAGHQDVSLNWSRVEGRFKPTSRQKLGVAKLSEAQMWGLSKWAMIVAEEVLEAHPSFIPKRPVVRSSDEASLDHMFRQYGNLMLRLCTKAGGTQYMHDRFNDWLEAHWDGDF